jgi:hypothetical protein
VRDRRLLVFPVAFCLLAGLFAAAGAGGARRAVPTTITFGVTEDATKYAEDGGTAYFNAMTDLGMSEDRVTVFWDENTPTKILEQSFLDRMMPVAAISGIRIVFVIEPIHARAFATKTPTRVAAFAAYVRQVALRYPQVREYVIGNEPNVRRFFQPQHDASGRIVSAGLYEQVMAAAYDTLKKVDPGIRVDGLAMSPRGNDQGLGVGAESVSPVRFIAAFGDAYRKSGRTTPLMDFVDVHSYAAVNTLPLTQPRKWPQAGAADLDRLKQAWWDAFHGTAQPLFQEIGDASSPVNSYVKFRIDESGTQVKIDPTRVDPKLYTGKENVPLVDEATQARYYANLIKLVKCDPTVETLDFFHLIDEPLLLGFQSGLLRVDRSRRPSYAAVKQAIAAARTCAAPHGWRHSTTVIGARAGSNVADKLAAQHVFWTTVSTGEEATAMAGIFAVGTRVRPAFALLRRSLDGGPATAAIPERGGLVKANSSRGFEFHGSLAPGQYVYAVLMRATMNPSRTSLLVSAPFTIR